MSGGSGTVPRVDGSVDVVIVQYGSYRFLFDCLDSLLKAEVRPHRILVVVNGIRDAPVEQIRQDFPAVEVIVNADNAGYPRAANQGLRASTAKYVVLLNNDLTVAPDWLAPLRAAAEADVRAALVQPKVLSSRDRTEFDYSGAAGGFMDAYGYPCARGRVFDTIERDRGQYDDGRELFWASGAALLIDRAAALEIGGFDEQFFIFHEETDLAWRLHLRGRTVRFCPQSRVFHFGSASFSESATTSRVKLYMMHRNDLLMLVKNWGPDELRFRLPVRVLLELAGLPRLAAQRSPEFEETLRALLWLLGHRRQAAAMRRTAQSLRTHPDSSYRHLLVRGILPLRYFLGGARSFPQLETYPPP